MNNIFIFLLGVLFIPNSYAQSDEIDHPAPMVSEEKVVKPQFPGGNVKLHEFIVTNMKIPETCYARNIFGQAIAQFMVDTNGYLINHKVLKVPSPECGYSEEVLRILSLLNESEIRWIPGMQRGRKVDVIFTMPIQFYIKD